MKYTKKNPIGLNLDRNEDSEINIDVSIFNKQIILLLKTIFNNLFHLIFLGKDLLWSVESQITEGLPTM